MTWDRPSAEQVWRAIEIYLNVAYPKAPPAAVRGRLDKLRDCEARRRDGDGGEAGAGEADAGDAGGLYQCEALERDGPEPSKYGLRLGCPVYPHMKLVIERAPDGQSHLFRADTHDKHCRPNPESKEYPLFCQMMEKNQQTAREIEAAWEAAGLPTFKTFLKADLARRAAAKG